MNDEQLDKLIDRMEKTKNSLWSVEKKIIGSLKNLALAGIEYAFMAWIFFWVYDHYGWERTLMTLAIGVILFGLRQRIDGGLRDLELKALREELAKLKK